MRHQSSCSLMLILPGLRHWAETSFMLTVSLAARSPIYKSVRLTTTTPITITTRKMSTAPRPTHYILSFYVPKDETSKVMAEVCKSGAGAFPGGLYTEAYWVTRGTGQFKSMESANPTIGKVGEVEKVEEDKVEILCVGKECVESAVKELLKVHPYEQVPYYVIKSEDV